MESIEETVEEGNVVLGDMEVGCAVLNDEQGTTVFILRTFVSVVGIGQKEGETVADFLPPFMRESSKEKYRDKYLSLSNFSLIPFKLRSGGKVLGIIVEHADEVMQGWIDAYHDGELEKSQMKVAECMQVMKNAASISVSGFIQIIHEQLEYVDIHKNKIFEKEYHSWDRRFDTEYYGLIYGLKGREDEWEKLLADVGPGVKPQTEGWLGNITNNIIYKRLKPFGILEVLQKKNPFIPGTKSRPRRHHQHLTKDQGLRILDAHLSAVIKLMKKYKTWDDFYKALDELYPIQNGQMRFPFMGPEFTKSSNDKDYSELSPENRNV